MSYLAIKYLHIACVSLSIGLFALRGSLQLVGVAWKRWLPLRIVPHVVDTVLLGSAIWLAIAIHQYPFVNGWLTAKLLALVAYVLLGKLALDAKTTPGRRPLAFVAALLCVTYIVGVAITKSPSWGM